MRIKREKIAIETKRFNPNSTFKTELDGKSKEGFYKTGAIKLNNQIPEEEELSDTSVIPSNVLKGLILKYKSEVRIIL